MLQTAHYTEERKIVGIDGQGSLGDAEATKSEKRTRPTATDWDREYANTSSEVPEDGGLSDEDLINIDLDNKYKRYPGYLLSHATFFCFLSFLLSSRRALKMPTFQIIVGTCGIIGCTLAFVAVTFAIASR